MKIRSKLAAGAMALSTAFMPALAGASSHREAPFITKNPKVDGTDFYMFNSYEGARAGYVTILANYLPLQDAYGGPNYFSLDSDALYEVHIDNSGDGVEDLTFQFDFDTVLANAGAGVALPVGAKSVAIPLVIAGGVSAGNQAAVNVLETYKINLVRGNRRTGMVAPVSAFGGSATFKKPLDNIGDKTFGGAYAAYANSFITEFDVPNCTPTGVAAGSHGRVFVGQRQESFPVNLGQIFDLVNGNAGNMSGGRVDLVGAVDQGKNIVGNKNITTIALEVPASCINRSGSTIVAGWTTASMRQARVINPTGTFAQPTREGGPWVQVSRLGMPLVNEVVIGLKDKNKFNNSEPKDDGQFADYVTNPTLPELLEILFSAAVPSVQAPNVFPRTDLITVFLTGVPTVNNTGATLFEAVRLNTGVPATSRAAQSTFGAVTCFDPPANVTVGPTLNLARGGCDPAGFPNGRRPGDDVVDIALRTVMGFLLSANDAPGRALPLVDGANLSATAFGNTFPYLNTPVPGSP